MTPFATDIQRNGDTYGVTGDARPFKRGDYADIAWTDGQMAACLKD